MRSSLVRFTAALSLATVCSFTAPAVFAQGAPPAATDPAKIEEAKKHMQAGAAFYNDPSGHKCEEAIREFGKAYDLSGSLNALKGQAVCNLELERDGEAIEQYTKYLAAKGAAIDPADKQQVETDLNTLRASVAHVTFGTDHAGVKLTDVRTPSKGFPISNRYPLPMNGRKLGIHPGQHTFTASAEGMADLTWTMEIVNGGKFEHTFEFNRGKPVVVEGDKIEKPEEPKMVARRPVPTGVYVMGGLTVALAVPFAIFGVSALGKGSDFKVANGHESKETLDGLASDVKKANLITDIFMGATIASAATTVILYVARPTKMVPENPAADALKAGSFHVLPTVGREGGGAVVVGAF
jgi:hypothetical protein